MGIKHYHKLIIGTLLAGVVGTATAAPVLHTTDFIDDLTRTGFNGFQNIPNNGVHYTGGAGPYVEQNIAVEQIGGDGGNDIWVNYGGNIGSNPSWYPDGGGTGYTQITLADGSDFMNFGFSAATGSGSNIVHYDLLLDGVSVLSGSTAAALTQGGGQYIGFGGGGFDTVRVRDGYNGGTGVYGLYTTLVLDNLEINGASVPAPAALTFLLVGLLGFSMRRRS